MAKNRQNRKVSGKKAVQDRKRNERRRLAIASRVAGQLDDLPPSKRQKIKNALKQHP